MTDLTPERSAMEAAFEAVQATRDALEAAAQAFARAGALAYSAAHPRRKVTLCICMGSTCLHVAPGGYFGHSDEYQISAGDDSRIQGTRIPSPEFLQALDQIEQALGYRHALGGDIRLECKGGKVISESFDW